MLICVGGVFSDGAFGSLAGAVPFRWNSGNVDLSKRDSKKSAYTNGRVKYERLLYKDLFLPIVTEKSKNPYNTTPEPLLQF